MGVTEKKKTMARGATAGRATDPVGTTTHGGDEPATRRRKTRTEADIRKALEKLLRKGGMEKLTVSAICREADINRGTFYAHYLDKFDLVDKQLDAIVTDVREALLSSGDDEDWSPERDGLISHRRLDGVIGYLYENRALIGALTNDGKDTRLMEHIRLACVEMIEARARQIDGLSLSYCGVPIEYGRMMLVSSMVSIIWLWVCRGCVESPEEISRIVFLNKDVRPADLLR